MRQFRHDDVGVICGGARVFVLESFERGVRGKVSVGGGVVW